MATAADLDRNANYRVPHGFFTSGLSEIDPAVEAAILQGLRALYTDRTETAQVRHTRRAIRRAGQSAATGCAAGEQ